MLFLAVVFPVSKQTYI